MSTIKSSDEHLTLNADGTSKDIKFQANGVEKASISSAGAFTSTTIDATALTGNLPAISAASLTNIPAANITGTLPAISGANLTNLPSGGKVLQVVQTVFTGIASQTNVTAQTTDYGGYGSAGLNWTDLDTTLTPSATSSKILVMINAQFATPANAVYGVYRLQRGINGATPSLSSSSGWMPPTTGSQDKWLSGAMISTSKYGDASGHGNNTMPAYAWQYLDSPNTTDAVKYRVNTYLKSDIGGAGTIFLNRTVYPNNDYGTGRGVSTVTLMEIAG